MEGKEVYVELHSSLPKLFILTTLKLFVVLKKGRSKIIAIIRRVRNFKSFEMEEIASAMFNIFPDGWDGNLKSRFLTVIVYEAVLVDRVEDGARWARFMSIM